MGQQFMRVEEVAEILDVSTSYAYKVIRELNEELKRKGFIIALVSVGIAAGVFVLAKIAFDRITEKCDDRWQYYKNTGVAELRKAVSVALCVISVTLSMLSVSLIPVDINVLSWWLILSAGLNFLYHGSCKGSYH